VITRPSTEQILFDCARVLQDLVAAVSDETAQVRIAMLQKVLQNAAVRSAHEIAWMIDEITAIEAYGQSVHAATGADSLRIALDDLKAHPVGSLHLDDVAASYAHASDVLSLALDAALQAQHADLVSSGESLLNARLAHENDIVGGWDSVGR
jgi:LPS sulfotransferase NodH